MSFLVQLGRSFDNLWPGSTLLLRQGFANDARKTVPLVATEQKNEVTPSKATHLNIVNTVYLSAEAKQELLEKYPDQPLEPPQPLYKSEHAHLTGQPPEQAVRKVRIYQPA